MNNIISYDEFCMLKEGVLGGAAVGGLIGGAAGAAGGALKYGTYGAAGGAAFGAGKKMLANHRENKENAGKAGYVKKNLTAGAGKEAWRLTKKAGAYGAAGGAALGGVTGAAGGAIAGGAIGYAAKHMKH